MTDVKAFTLLRNPQSRLQLRVSFFSCTEHVSWVAVLAWPANKLLLGRPLVGVSCRFLSGWSHAPAKCEPGTTF